MNECKIPTARGGRWAASQVADIQSPEELVPRMKKTVRDLNVAEDRAYLLKRGFVWAVIYPHGERRGKVISAHKEEKGVNFALKYLRNDKVDVVKIAEYPYHLS